MEHLGTGKDGSALEQEHSCVCVCLFAILFYHKTSTSVEKNLRNVWVKVIVVIYVTSFLSVVVCYSCYSRVGPDSTNLLAL